MRSSKRSEMDRDRVRQSEISLGTERQDEPF